MLKAKKAFLFDLDGCIYYGDKLAPGSKELLNLLRAEGKKVGFITNNSRENSVEIAEKLSRMGLETLPSEIVTATDYVGEYILNQYGHLNVKVAGSLSLSNSLSSYGHSVIPFHAEQIADLIVIGRDTAFNYVKLQQIVNEIERGSRIVSANPDFYHLGSDGGRVPETGSLVAAIDAILGITVEFLGKPRSYLFQRGMQNCGSTPSESVMVGDNLLTDISGGLQGGMTTIWIQGDQKDSLLDDHNSPHITVKQMEDLFHLFHCQTCGSKSVGR